MAVHDLGERHFFPLAVIFLFRYCHKNLYFLLIKVGFFFHTYHKFDYGYCWSFGHTNGLGRTQKVHDVTKFDIHRTGHSYG